MLHVALAGLIAGSLALTPPDGTGDDKKNPNVDKPATESVATPGVFETAPAEGPQSVTVDTYAMGRPVAAAPIKLWVQYAYGTADEYYDRSGNDQNLNVGGGVRLPNGAFTAGSVGQAVSQRIAVGAQVNFISLSRFALGAGAQLGIAKNEFDVETPGTLGIQTLESSFGLQQVKVYGTARGRVLGIHAGYAFDLGEEATANANGIPTDLANSDGRDALFLGADFDYPSERFRLFGGIDFYNLYSSGTPETNDFRIGGDFLNFAFGTGLRFGIGEIGAAFQLQTRFDEPTLENVGTTRGIGSHIGTVVPYLRISPPNLPASIYVKGATPDEYFEYGYGIGGSNSVKPGIGITAGLSVGFN